MSALWIRRNAALIQIGLLVALMVPALCWTQRAIDAFGLPPDLAADKVVLLAWQELILTGPEGETTQRMATRAAELRDWRNAIGAVDAVGLLDFKRAIIASGDELSVARLALFDATSASLLNLPCDARVAYSSAANHIGSTLGIDGSKSVVRRLPSTLAGVLLVRSQGAELLRCEPDLPAGAFVLLQARIEEGLEARIHAADGRSSAAFGRDSRTQTRVVDLREELEKRLGYRATWARSALFVVGFAGWLAVATLLLIEHLRRRDEFRIRVMLGGSVSRLILYGLQRLLPVLTLGALLGAVFHVQLGYGDGLRRSVSLLLSWLVSVMVMAVVLFAISAKRAVRDTFQPLSTLSAGNSAMSGALALLSGLVLTALVTLSAPLVSVQKQIASAAATQLGYSTTGLWTWRIRLADAAVPKFDLRGFAEQLTVLKVSYPGIVAMTFMDRGPWSFSGFEGVKGPVGLAFAVGPEVAGTLQLSQYHGRDFAAQDIPGRAIVAQRTAASITSLVFRGVPSIAELDGLQVDALNSGLPPKLVLSAAKDGELQDFEIIVRMREHVTPTAELRAAFLRMLPHGSVVSSAHSVPTLLAERLVPLRNLNSVSALVLFGGGSLLLLLGAVVFASSAAASRRQWGIRMALGSTASGAISGWLLRFAVFIGVSCALGALLGTLLVQAVAQWVPGFVANPALGVWAALALLLIVLIVGSIIMRWMVSRMALTELLRSL